MFLIIHAQRRCGISRSKRFTCRHAARIEDSCRHIFISTLVFLPMAISSRRRRRHSYGRARHGDAPCLTTERVAEGAFLMMFIHARALNGVSSPIKYSLSTEITHFMKII